MIMEQTTVQTESVVEQETTDLTIVQLPDEVQAIALRVSDEKRSEVTNTLQQVFAGTADWKAQVDMIVVKDPTDKMGMNLAKTARLNAKNARLAAEKLFDQKRDEVQAQMLSYQTEDKLWLKAKQTMQILFKEIEAAAEYKEKTAERYENEQHELKIQTRLTRLASVSPEISRQEIELMSDLSFDAFLGGLVKAKEDAIKAEREEQERQEAARKLQERNTERFKVLSGTGMVYLAHSETFEYGSVSFPFAELSQMEDDEFEKIISEITSNLAKLKDAEEKERLRLAELARKQAEELEAERKKAEAERENQVKLELQKKERNAKRNTELRPFIIFIRDYSAMLEMDEDTYQKQFEEIKKGAEEHWEFERKEQIRKQKEQQALEEKARAEAEKAAKEKAALEAELKARQQAEAQQEAQRIAKEKAAALAAKAPRKERLTNWVDSFSIPVFAGDDVAVDIMTKFDAFKNWAKAQVEKI